MERDPSDLTHEEAEAWMRELGYVEGRKADWARLLHEAGVKTHKDMLKQRWLKGESPQDRAKIRARLLEVEAKRKQHTSIGWRLIALEEWERIGEALVLERETMQRQIDLLKPVAEAARKKHDHARGMHAADEELQRALGSITPPDHGTRR